MASSHNVHAYGTFVYGILCTCIWLSRVGGAAWATWPWPANAHVYGSVEPHAPSPPPDACGELPSRRLRRASERGRPYARLQVHVLQQLNHRHIVRVMDVIEVVDATYIIMERVDGPELTEYIALQPERRLRSDLARQLLCHVLSALHHAHAHGFVHCDIKPDNIRLSKERNHAVLTDWGYARKPGMRPESVDTLCGIHAPSFTPYPSHPHPNLHTLPTPGSPPTSRRRLPPFPSPFLALGPLHPSPSHSQVRHASVCEP